MTDYSSSYDDDDDQDDSGSSNPVRQLREQNKKLTKDLKDAQKRMSEFEDLKAFKEKYETESRNSKATDLFESMGLSQKEATLFSRLNPDTDPTEELVEKFAVEDLGYEVQYVDEDGEAADAPEPEGFAPTAITGQQTASKPMSTDEWLQLAASDPRAAQAAYSAKKVDRTNLREGLGRDYE